MSHDGQGKFDPSCGVDPAATQHFASCKRTGSGCSAGGSPTVFTMTLWNRDRNAHQRGNVARPPHRMTESEPVKQRDSILGACLDNMSLPPLKLSSLWPQASSSLPPAVHSGSTLKGIRRCWATLKSLSWSICRPWTSWVGRGLSYSVTDKELMQVVQWVLGNHSPPPTRVWAAPQGQSPFYCSEIGARQSIKTQGFSGGRSEQMHATYLVSPCVTFPLLLLS